MVPDTARPIRLGLLLLPGFALLGYAALIEAFRGANTLSGRTLYEWRHYSPDGMAAEASNGARIVADARIGRVIDCSVLFVFAGGDPRAFDDRATFVCLRHLTRQGTCIAGISGGVYVLARAGLLTRRRVTIHWEYRPLLREEFPELTIERGLYVIDGPIITCAGGTAGLDLALDIVARDHGRDLARRVGEWFISTAPREPAEPQRHGLAERYGTTSGAVLKALQIIESRIDRPVSRGHLARATGLSLRQLERLFAEHLGQGLAATAMAIRLDAAMHRLRTTGLDVTAIALDCGFASAAHFSRRFRLRFGMPPSAVRAGRVMADPSKVGLLPVQT